MIAKDIMRTGYLAIDGNERISKLIGHLVNNQQRAAVVFDGNNYIGVTYSRLLLRNKIDVHSWKVKRICQRPAVLHGDEDLAEIVRLMYVSDSPLLPVMHGGVIGVVVIEDLLRWLKPAFKGLKVSDLVLGSAFTITENDRMGKAVEMMFEEKIDRLPVLDKDNRISGIVTISDFMTKFFLSHYSRDKGISYHNVSKGWNPNQVDMDGLKIKHFMEPVVVKAREYDPVNEVIEVMFKNNILCVPIVNAADNVTCLLTARDLLKKFYIFQRGNIRKGI